MMVYVLKINCVLPSLVRITTRNTPWVNASQKFLSQCSTEVKGFQDMCSTVQKSESFNGTK